jgi:coenzyme PQQ precursor peptide PqqA
MGQSTAGLGADDAREAGELIGAMSMTINKRRKKRTWAKPIIQEEQAGMEVTSYTSAGLARLGNKQ